MSIFVIEFSCFSRVNSEAEARKILGKASLPLPKGGLPLPSFRFASSSLVNTFENPIGNIEVIS